MSLPAPPAYAQIKIDPKMLAAMQAPLVDLAQKSGGDLRKLLFAFFHFLNERTDFYCIPHEDDIGTMGFKEGDAEKLLLAAFRQFPLRKLPKKTVATTAAGSKLEKVKPIETVNEPGTSHTASARKDKQAVEPKAVLSLHDEDAIRLTDEGLQIPVGNGGATPRYRWTQNLDEANLVIAVPKDTRGKDLDVTIKVSSISVKMNHALEVASGPLVLLEGNLVEPIQTDESTWSLEGGCMLLVLQKQKKTWWDTVILGDDKIDTTLVDSTRKIDSYDEVTQANIRRILFDQRQERLGLKTSDQIMRGKGEKPALPPLPVGVEYIDKDTLDKHAASKNK
jgi:N-terminal conserved domain of Nudc./CS domain